MPSGFLGGSREYLISSPFLGIFCSLIRASVWWLTASMASLMSCVISLSKVHWSNGLLSMGKRLLGLVQLNGLSLVPNPPARISAFSLITSVLKWRFIWSEVNKTVSWKIHAVSLSYEILAW